MFKEKKWFWLSENKWNNSFSFFEWKKIWIPEVKIWKISEIKLWEKIVFSDFENEILKESIWLEKHLWILEEKKSPVFICDNHNRVLESWQYFKNKKPLLVHIDQHRDEADFWKIENWEKDLRICDYIKWAKSENWIKKNHISLCESKDFEKFKNLENEDLWDFILNIDLDIFVPEQTLISHKKIWELIFILEKKALLVNFATSPLFLNQKKAIEMLNYFFSFRNKKQDKLK